MPTISYTLTELDFINGYKIRGRLTPIEVVIFILSLIIFIFLLFRGGFGFMHLLYGLFIFGIIIGWLIKQWILSARARKIYRKYSEYSQPQLIQFKDSILYYGDSTKIGQFKDFGQIYGWRQVKDYMIIRIKKDAFIIIPKRIEKQGFDLSGLSKALRTKD